MLVADPKFTVGRTLADVATYWRKLVIKFKFCQTFCKKCANCEDIKSAQFED